MHFTRTAASMTLLLWLLLGVGAAQGQDERKAERKEVYNIDVLPRIEGNRFKGIRLDVMALTKVRLVPGDTVKYEFKGNSTFNAEEWSQKFTWKTERKDGKDTIIETHEQVARKTVTVTLGSDDFDPSVTLGNIEIVFAETPIEPLPRVKVPFDASSLDPDQLPQPETIDLGDPSVSRPPQLPADARPAGSAETKATFIEGRELGVLQITVSRATRNNNP